MVRVEIERYLRAEGGRRSHRVLVVGLASLWRSNSQRGGPGGGVSGQRGFARLYLGREVDKVASEIQMTVLGGLHPRRE